jgi:hypothetical protein
MSELRFDICELVKTGQLISSDKYQRYSRNHSHILYTHRDFLYRQGDWRGIYQDRLVKNRQLFKNKVIVVGHSDWATNWYQSLIFKQLGAHSLYGINVVPSNNFSFTLPLGLTNDCDDSVIHRILGNENHFISAHEHTMPLRKFDGSIYANFTVENFSRERKPLMELLRSLPNTKFEKVEMTNSGRITYLSNLRKNSLVPCPRGNGVDTHRLWETLYMGGTPVILRNKMMEILLRGLPVIFINSWIELKDLNRMEQLWVECLEMNEFDKLKVSFWLEKLPKVNKNL